MDHKKEFKNNFEIKEYPIEGVYELSSKRIFDSRGFFLNCFKEENFEFQKIWKGRHIKQINLSKTLRKGTIRGLHFQREPFSECKLIRCLRGSVWDVAVDLRQDSPTYLSWLSVEISAELDNCFVIPEGCAHGFQSLEDDTELLYIHSNIWKPSYEKGIRWDDKTININWPLDPINISEKDLSLPEV